MSRPMPRITCPSCHVASQAPDGQALAGRRLRCPHCRTVWRTAPAAPPPGPVRALVPVERPTAEAEISAPLVPARPINRPPRRARTIIDVNPPRAAPSYPPRAMTARRIDAAGIAACLLAGLLVIGAVTLREPIVRFAPGLAGLYGLAGLEVNLRGLAFGDITLTRDDSGAGPVLVVGGTVTNVTGEPVAVPAIRLALKAANRHELYAWQIEPETPQLAPGETYSFRSELARPTDPATDLEVRFADRRRQLAQIP